MESKYIVSIYAGIGIITQNIEVLAYNESEALEAAMATCQQNNWHALYWETDELNTMNYSESEKDELFIYIDPTLVEPLAHPAYFDAHGVNVQKVA